MSGKTVYQYDGGFMPTIHTTPLYPYPLKPKQWYLAPLVSVIRYEYRDGRYEWVQREKYVYNKYLDSTLIYRCRVWSPLEAEFQTNVTGRDFEQWKFDKVKGSLQFSVSGLHTGCLQLVTKEVQTRDAQGRVSTDRTRYRYDSPNCYAVGRIERTMSDGTTLVAQTLYPEAERSPSWSSGTSFRSPSSASGGATGWSSRASCSVTTSAAIRPRRAGWRRTISPKACSACRTSPRPERSLPKRAAPHSRRMRATPKFSRHASTTTAIRSKSPAARLPARFATCGDTTVCIRWPNSSAARMAN